MPACDGFFEDEGIPYLPEYQDAAVYAAWTADFHSPQYKKWLILCWFDTTYGEWNGPRFSLRDARAKASEYLKQTPYSTFEELLDAPELRTATSTKR